MAETRVRKSLFLLLGLLLAFAVLTAIALHDSELETIRVISMGYIGDLQKNETRSAAQRIYPGDVLELKAASLDYAAVSQSFRGEAEVFFQTDDPQELRAQPRLRFFEFLVHRTYQHHPLAQETLRRGRIIGVSAERTGDSARVDVSLSLATEEGERRFVMKLKLARDDDQWMIRL